MNPLVGVTAAAYEAWNIQYATLTDKAAADFAVIPGLAESWEGSEDGRTWTYTMRPNLKWSDGQPLTAEDVAYTINRSRDEEWINHTSVVANLRARAVDDRTLVVRTSVPDPKLPDARRLHRPQAHLVEVRRGPDPRVRRQRRRRLGAVRARAHREGAVRALPGQPELLGRPTGGRPRRDAQVQQPRRDGGGPEARRDRRGDRTSPATRSSNSRRTPTSRRSGVTRAR